MADTIEAARSIPDVPDAPNAAGYTNKLYKCHYYPCQIQVNLEKFDGDI